MATCVVMRMHGVDPTNVSVSLATRHDLADAVSMQLILYETTPIPAHLC